jgi:hypothetical protein
VTLYLAVTVVLYTLTTELVKPVHRWQFDRRRVSGVLLLLLLLGGGLWVVFATDLGNTSVRSATGPDLIPTPAPAVPVPVVREVSVEMVRPTEAPPGDGVAVTPEPTPPPTATPTPWPAPAFEAKTYETTIEGYLAEKIVPSGEVKLCEASILGGEVGQSGHARAFVWAYCRAFDIGDGAVAPGILVSAPAEVFFFSQPNLGWEINTHTAGNTSAFPPEVLTQLENAAYDEKEIDARLLERAREILLEDEGP